MELLYFRELLDISIVPKMKFEYYEALRSRYNHMIDPTPPRMPEPPQGPYLSSDSIERKHIVLRLFAQMKRSQHG